MTTQGLHGRPFSRAVPQIGEQSKGAAVMSGGADNQWYAVKNGGRTRTSVGGARAVSPTA
jgi:hypothetical protein